MQFSVLVKIARTSYRVHQIHFTVLLSLFTAERGLYLTVKYIKKERIDRLRFAFFQQRFYIRLVYNRHIPAEQSRSDDPQQQSLNVIHQGFPLFSYFSDILRHSKVNK